MNVSKLAKEVEYEVKQLRTLAAFARELAAAPEGERRPWDAAAAAKYAADVCHGLENLCRRRYKALGLREPLGPESHSQTLAEFLKDPKLGGRLKPEIAGRLQSYLRFRHRFIHGYGYEVTWEMVAEPLALIPETVEALAQVWLEWLAAQT
jgi:hypothetical protein